MQNRFVNIFFFYLHTSGIIELMSNTLKRILMFFNLNPAFINPKNTYYLVNTKHGMKFIIHTNIKTFVNANCIIRNIYVQRVQVTIRRKTPSFG